MQFFYDKKKNRKLANIQKAYISMVWYFGGKKGLYRGMAWLPFQKLVNLGLELLQSWNSFKTGLVLFRTVGTLATVTSRTTSVTAIAPTASGSSSVTWPPTTSWRPSRKFGVKKNRPSRQSSPTFLWPSNYSLPCWYCPWSALGQ